MYGVVKHHLFKQVFYHRRFRLRARPGIAAALARCDMRFHFARAFFKFRFAAAFCFAVVRRCGIYLEPDFYQIMVLIYVFIILVLYYILKRININKCKVLSELFVIDVPVTQKMFTLEKIIGCVYYIKKKSYYNINIMQFLENLDDETLRLVSKCACRPDLSPLGPCRIFDPEEDRV